MIFNIDTSPSTPFVYIFRFISNEYVKMSSAHLPYVLYADIIEWQDLYIHINRSLEHYNLLIL